MLLLWLFLLFLQGNATIEHLVVVPGRLQRARQVGMQHVFRGAIHSYLLAFGQDPIRTVQLGRTNVSDAMLRSNVLFKTMLMSRPR